jgi:hypothetical protein
MGGKKGDVWPSALLSECYEGTTLYLPAAPLTLKCLIPGRTVLRDRGHDQKLCCFVGRWRRAMSGFTHG